MRSSEKNSTRHRSVVSIGVSLEAPLSRPLSRGTLLLPDQTTTTNPPTWTSIQTRAARRRRHRHRRNPLRPLRPLRPPRPLPPPRPPRRLEPRLKSPRRRQAPRRRSNRDNRAPRGRPRHPQGPALPASGGLSDLHIALPNAIWWPSSLTPSPSNQTACASSMRGMLTRGERLTRLPGSLRRIRC